MKCTASVCVGEHVRYHGVRTLITFDPEWPGRWNGVLFFPAGASVSRGERYRVLTPGGLEGEIVIEYTSGGVAGGLSFPVHARFRGEGELLRRPRRPRDSWLPAA